MIEQAYMYLHLPLNDDLVVATLFRIVSISQLMRFLLVQSNVLLLILHVEISYHFLLHLLQCF